MGSLWGGEDGRRREWGGDECDESDNLSELAIYEQVVKAAQKKFSRRRACMALPQITQSVLPSCAIHVTTVMIVRAYISNSLPTPGCTMRWNGALLLLLLASPHGLRHHCRCMTVPRYGGVGCYHISHGVSQKIKRKRKNSWSLRSSVHFSSGVIARRRRAQRGALQNAEAIHLKGHGSPRLLV